MKDKLFELEDVLEVLDLETRSDFWWSDYCEITHDGFLPKRLDSRDEELLSGGPELAEMRKLLRNLKLELPCTREQLIDWAERCGFDSELPDEFFNEPEPQAKAPAVEDNGKDTRTSQLHSLIWRVRQHVYSNGKGGSAQKVWNEIQYRHEQHDTDKIIQQVTATEILWRSVYGNEPKLQRRCLDALLNRLKKSPPF
jgi:hypothetical protein